jgi:DNA-binding response OmpR family regulator
MRILLVEDDSTVADGIRRGLQAEGFTVEIATDGATGLGRARSNRFDLIILDVMLPKMNGYRVCRALRSDERWTPILMLTAKSGEHDEAEGLELGADDFLSKPFSMVVLQARVRALLRRPAGRAEWPAVGGIRLDPLHRRCIRDGEPVDLTARELEVLAYFLERPDAVVHKDELLDAIWGRDFEGDRNLVEVYVSHLRRKLDEPFGHRSFETVRRVGYRFVPDRATECH